MNKIRLKWIEWNIQFINIEINKTYLLEFQTYLKIVIYYDLWREFHGWNLYSIYIFMWIPNCISLNKMFATYIKHFIFYFCVGKTKTFVFSINSTTHVQGMSLQSHLKVYLVLFWDGQYNWFYNYYYEV